MEIEERREKAAIVVSPAGRLDSASAQVLEGRVAVIAGRGETDMVLDCGGVSYVSSAGLRAMLLAARMCLRGGGRLTVAALRPACRRIVSVSGLLTVLDYCETVEAALAAEDRPGRADGREAREQAGRAAMEVEERKEGPAVVMSPVGRLNGVGARALEARISEAVRRGDVLLVLDCVRMTYVNSTGLRALLLCAKACQQEGGRFAIAGLSPECRSVMDMSGFLSVIDYHETSEAAVAALA